MAKNKSMPLFVDNMDILVVWKKIRGFWLTVYPDASIRMSVPLWAGSDDIMRFAQSRMEWLKEKSASVKAKNAQARPDNCPLVWGEAAHLEITRDCGKDFAHFANGVLKINVCEKSPQELLEAWRARELRDKAGPLLEIWRQKMNLRPIAFFARKMKTRWGSCTPGLARIRLNTQLVSKPPQCLEYVIVHELVHMLEKGHGMAFYNLMDKYLPDWRARRMILKNSP